MTRIKLAGKIPESQHWTLQEPHRSAIERGLKWAAENPRAETDLDDLLEEWRRRHKADSSAGG